MVINYLLTNQISDATVGFHCYLALKHDEYIGISLAYFVVYTSDNISATNSLSCSLVDHFIPPTNASFS